MHVALDEKVEEDEREDGWKRIIYACERKYWIVRWKLIGDIGISRRVLTISHHDVGKGWKNDDELSLKQCLLTMDYKDVR